jgi:hypothetical protein
MPAGRPIAAINDWKAGRFQQVNFDASPYALRPVETTSAPLSNRHVRLAIESRPTLTICRIRLRERTKSSMAAMAFRIAAVPGIDLLPAPV